MITARQLVADAASGHRVEGLERHRHRVEAIGFFALCELVATALIEQIDQVHRLGELGTTGPGDIEAEAAEFGVELVGEGGSTSLSQLAGQRDERVRLRPAERRLPDDARQFVGVLLDLGLAVLPDDGDLFEDRGELVGLEVRPAIERPAIGGEEDRHRPASRAVHGLDGGHVNLVDVGAFLAVDLDRHVTGVEQFGDRRVHEALALHDVAPVARAIADRQENRLVLRLRLRERLGTPRIPIHRVVRVEQQVRTRLLRQTVRRALRLRLGVVGEGKWPKANRGQQAKKHANLSEAKFQGGLPPGSRSGSAVFRGWVIRRRFFRSGFPPRVQRCGHRETPRGIRSRVAHSETWRM